METIANITGYLGRNSELIARTDKMSKYRFTLILECGQGKDLQGTMAVACEVWAGNGEYWPAMLSMGTWVSVMGSLSNLVAGNDGHYTGLAYMEVKEVVFV